MVKVTELRRLEQEGKTIEKFVQELRRVVRRSRYEGRLLIEEFKRRINRIIYQRLIKAECQPSSIK